MALYCVSIDGREFKVHLSGNKGVVDGEPIEIDLTRLNDAGLHLLNRKRQALELHMSPRDGDTYDVLVDGRRLMARVQTLAKRLRQRNDTASARSLNAPMPGLVVNILVSAGEVVEAGQTLVVLESMKMQMQLRSAIAGQVESVHVQKNQQVEKGALLVHLVPQAN
jgi:biotin carboxyl carrier protein